MALVFGGFDDIGLLVLRIFIGWIFIYHAWPKLADSKGLATAMGKPNWSKFMMFLGTMELIGGVAVIIGFLTEIASLGLIVIMLSAIYLKAVKMNVNFLSIKSTGWEFEFMILGAAIALAFIGAGGLSIDGFLGQPFYP